MVEARFSRTSPSSKLLYRVLVLYCLGHYHLFTHLVGVVVDSEERLLESLLLEHQQASRSLKQLIRVQGIAWIHRRCGPASESKQYFSFSPLDLWPAIFHRYLATSRRRRRRYAEPLIVMV